MIPHVLHPDVLLGLVRNDLALFADRGRSAEAGSDAEVAMATLVHAGWCERAGGDLTELREKLRFGGLIDAAAQGIADVDLAGDLQRLREYEDGEVGPGREEDLRDAAESFLLARDDAELVLSALLRFGKEATVSLGASVARRLAAVDEEVRGELHLLFPAIPLIRAVRERVPPERLDARRFWWWYDPITERDALGTTPERVVSYRCPLACTGGLADRDALLARAALLPAGAPEARSIESHAEECAACREALSEVRAIAATVKARPNRGGGKIPPSRTPCDARPLAAAPPGGATPISRARRDQPILGEFPIEGTEVRAVVVALQDDALSFRFLDRDGHSYSGFDGGGVSIEHASTGAVVVQAIEAGAARVSLPPDRFPSLDLMAFLLASDGRRVPIG